ncbi:MAG: glutamate-1-semialdehyde-2,1-aminomutase [Deltaproteobacteria bacterium]|nr:MAG: glutamate-1-semialdehyde-2,1-aminomutase [Deltaproteobacteria bacterium]
MGRSEELFEEARRFIPGGVNSPVRAFKAVGGIPRFIARAQGARVWDVDGREYIDYVASWGPMILGHAYPRVVQAVRERTERGTSYGAPTALEVELARTIVEALPSVEMVRMVNSGTEAVMSAIRLARAFTGRDKVLKFEGCYHGHADGLLVKAGSGATTLGVPLSSGVPASYAELTLLAPFNDLEAVQRVMAEHRGEVACVIVEPVAGNMGVVLPEDGFLQGLREICDQEDVLLIFDEVITGFRVGWSGAQGLYGVMPDLTCLGKIIGGGLPVGAFGGRREIMELLAPSGPVYQAGTLSGNPLACAAGLETLRILREEAPYEELEERTSYLCSEIHKVAEEVGVEVTVNQIGSMFTGFFAEGPIRDYASAMGSDLELHRRFFWAMLRRGVYLPPSQFEAAFLSTAHGPEEMERTLSAVKEGLREISGGLR